MNIYIKITLLFLFITCQVEANTEIPDEVFKALDKGVGDSPTSESSSSVNAFELNASTDEKTASIKISPIKGSNNFSVLFTAPLDEDTSEAKFYDSKTDAFTNAFSVKVNYKNVLFGKSKLEPIFAEKYVEYCEENPDVFNFKKAEDCNVKIDTLTKNFNKEKGDISGFNMTDFWASILTEPIQLYGFTATAGKKDFEYFKVNSLETDTEGENPLGASVYYTYVVPNEYMITLEYEFQRKFEAQKSITKCPNDPEEGEDILNCITGISGAPEKSTNRNISISLRVPVPLNGFNLALSPKLTHNTADDSTKFSLPIYFLQDSKSNLTGGIKSSWDSENHEWVFGLFVGQKFNLF
ncbi:hypothetical protein [Thalassotalea sp. G2M2-11]|uniref:hypothetical protein n=1 Tax=Thalassotalea sp. G2M2-11 TaxID=2787627 RepID=UPI0019D1780A|nr:hypothetical protein [Thalassotalea sp. G2M2-11]